MERFNTIWNILERFNTTHKILSANQQFSGAVSKRSK
jgi:hypothetical protein